MTDYLWLLIPLVLIVVIVLLSIVKGGSRQRLPLNKNAANRREFLKFAGVAVAATALPKSEQLEGPKKTWYDPRTWKNKVSVHAGRAMTTGGPNTCIGYKASQCVTGDDSWSRGVKEYEEAKKALK